jgi:hypothetical protein
VSNENSSEIGVRKGNSCSQEEQTCPPGEDVERLSAVVREDAEWLSAVVREDAELSAVEEGCGVVVSVVGGLQI